MIEKATCAKEVWISGGFAIRNRLRRDRTSPESREKTGCQAHTHLGVGDEQT